MKTISKISAVAFAAMMVAPVASASSIIIIDDFQAFGSVTSNFGGNPATGDFPGVGGEVIGGNRFMWVSNDTRIPPSNAPSTGSAFISELGDLSFINGAASTSPDLSGRGQAVIIYDGGNAAGRTNQTFTFLHTPPELLGNPDFPTATTANIAVDIDGLAVSPGVGQDLLMGDLVTQRGFDFGVKSFDPDSSLDFRAYVWDMDGELATYQELLTSGPGALDLNFDTFLGFNEFAFNAATFDWDNVGAIAFSVEGVSTEFAGILTEISVVPLPASALLMLGGLGGLVGASAVSKRRRRKQV